MSPQEKAVIKAMRRHQREGGHRDTRIHCACGWMTQDATNGTEWASSRDAQCKSFERHATREVLLAANTAPALATGMTGTVALLTIDEDLGALPGQPIVGIRVEHDESRRFRLGDSVVLNEAAQCPSLEAALFNVESIHHIHGQECLCGFKSAVSRERTKHIMEAVLEALSPLVAALDGQLDAADRQIAARSGETSAERVWRSRAEAAEAKVASVRELAARLLPVTERDPNIGQDTEEAHDEGHTEGWNEALTEIARLLDGVA